jgi:hypothetical protein
MNYYQRSKRYIKKGANALNSKLEHKSVKKIKRVVIIIFAALLLLDIVFVLPNKFPTISKVVLFSSPKNLFIIWLWGVATANIFFPRKFKHVVKIRIIGFILLIAITVPLYFVGQMISRQSTGLECSDSATIPPSFFTEIICYNDVDHKVDCVDARTPCSYVRIDINTRTKAMLIIAGMLFGYFLWPQLEREVDEVGTIST